MNNKQITAYEDRISKVCEYINHNLDEALTLDSLSDVAAFSKYHFHRIFSAYTGMSVIKFIQLARLKRASFCLVFEKEQRIIDIALEAGFESPEAFSRAFKRVSGQSPSEFRASPQWPQWHARFRFNLKSYGVTQMKVDVVNFEATNVAVLEHLGPPDKVFDTIALFIQWRKETGLSPTKTSKTFGIPYSDPKTTEPDEFRWDICGTENSVIPENKYGVKAGTIPSGKCAVVRHKGSRDNLGEIVYALYRDWLPNSGESLRDYPCFVEYLNFSHEVDECDLVTDVYLPLE